MLRHTFKVGQVVRVSSHLVRPGARTPAMELERTQFEIVRLMPEEGSLLQYRVKNRSSGQERLVTEADLQSDI